MKLTVAGNGNSSYMVKNIESIDLYDDKFVVTISRDGKLGEYTHNWHNTYEITLSADQAAVDMNKFRSCYKLMKTFLMRQRGKK